jgi:putative spermidine/putrescine transport system substrate-binding protein
MFERKIKSKVFNLFMILLIGIVLAMGLVSDAQEKKSVLKVGCWAGAYTNTLKAVIGPFEKEYNVTVEWVASDQADMLVKSRAKVIDVIFGDPIYSYIGEAQDLWEKLDEKSIPNLNRLYDFEKLSDYTIVVDFGITGIAYNPKFIKEPPTSLLDLWDPKYKGKVSISSSSTDGIDLLVLMAKLNGGDERHIDPGFKKMSEIKDNIHTWHKGYSEILTLLKNEDVWLTMLTNGRVVWARGEGANIDWVIPKEGGFATTSTINIVKGTENLELAKKFVNWRLSDPPQKLIAETLFYVPSVSGVILDPETAKMMPTNEEINNISNPDWRYILTVYDAWTERWDKEVYHQE